MAVFRSDSPAACVGERRGEEQDDSSTLSVSSTLMIVAWSGVGGASEAGGCKKGRLFSGVFPAQRLLYHLYLDWREREAWLSLKQRCWTYNRRHCNARCRHLHRRILNSVLSRFKWSEENNVSYLDLSHDRFWFHISCDADSNRSQRLGSSSFHNMGRRPRLLLSGLGSQERHFLMGLPPALNNKYTSNFLRESISPQKIYSTLTHKLD